MMEGKQCRWVLVRCEPHIWMLLVRFGCHKGGKGSKAGRSPEPACAWQDTRESAGTHKIGFCSCTSPAWDTASALRHRPAALTSPGTCVLGATTVAHGPLHATCNERRWPPRPGWARAAATTCCAPSCGWCIRSTCCCTALWHARWRRWEALLHPLHAPTCMHPLHGGCRSAPHHAPRTMPCSHLSCTLSKASCSLFELHQLSRAMCEHRGATHAS